MFVSPKWDIVTGFRRSFIANAYRRVLHGYVPRT